MQKVNAKIFALKYKLLKVLTNSIEKDKNAIKNGAEITFKDYAKIQVVNCTKSSYSKEDQIKLDEYAKSIGITKHTTQYIRIDIDNIPQEAEDTAYEIVNELKDSNYKAISKLASKIANTK